MLPHCFWQESRGRSFLCRYPMLPTPKSGILTIPLTYHLESCHILEELAVKKGKSGDL